jgi:hypothetical protein
VPPDPSPSEQFAVLMFAPRSLACTLSSPLEPGFGSAAGKPSVRLELTTPSLPWGACERRNPPHRASTRAAGWLDVAQCGAGRVRVFAPRSRTQTTTGAAISVTRTEHGFA